MMKLFSVLLSPIGRVASRPMRNIETYPSKHMGQFLQGGENGRLMSFFLGPRGPLIEPSISVPSNRPTTIFPEFIDKL